MLYWAVLVMAFSNVLGQDVKFGRVSKEELQQKQYPEDTTASAAVLYRKVRVYYHYSQGQGFDLKTDVHERIKIYKKDGFGHATINERLYTGGRGNSDKEKFSGLKAFTYNIVNGQVEDSKVKGSDTYTKEVSKYYDEVSFTMPNVTEGSIIEYQYTLTSPYVTTIDEISLQYDIPIKYQEIRVSIPEYFVFAPKMKGYLDVRPNKSTEQGKINYTSKSRTGGRGLGLVDTSFKAQSFTYTKNISTVVMRKVPALVEEPYVNSMENYRTAIDYELKYIQYPNEPMKPYATTWEEVARKIYDSDNFGRQLSQRKFFKEDLAMVIEGTTNDKEKLVRIFDHVRNHMNWNSYFGKYSDLGIKKAYAEKTGNVADINLLLVAMLKESGVMANPVLVSTRDNGVPMFPTREGFNYVVASANIDGQTVLMDATNKFAQPNLLPTRALNWMGLVIGEDGMSSSIDMNANEKAFSSEQIMVNITGEGSVEGRIRNMYSGYAAYRFRNRYLGQEEEAYLEDLEYKKGGAQIDGYTIKNHDTLGKDIQESYEIVHDGVVDIVNNRMYFSPMLFETEDENPFKLDERVYPIDFVTPWEDKCIVMIKYPPGYVLESKPEAMKMALPDGKGLFTYMVQETPMGLQIVKDVKINRAIFPANEYQSLKEFFNQMVNKLNEKVVLIKKVL